MSELPPASAAAQRVQAIVVCGILAVFYGVGLEIGLLALAVMVVVWPPKVPWTPLPLRRVLVAYGLFLLAWVPLLFGYLQLMHWLGWTVAPQPMLRQMAQEGVAAPGFALGLVAVVVFAPVFEEIVFRGYLFGALATFLPPIATHLVVALLFGLVHGIDYALPIGLLALLLGWLRAKHRSLLPSILAHAVHNGLSVAAFVAWPALLDLMYPQ